MAIYSRRNKGQQGSSYGSINLTTQQVKTSRSKKLFQALVPLIFVFGDIF